MQRIVEEEDVDVEGGAEGVVYKAEGKGGRHGNEAKAWVMTPAVRNISLLFTFLAVPRVPAVCDADGAVAVSFVAAFFFFLLCVSVVDGGTMASPGSTARFEGDAQSGGGGCFWTKP